MSSLAATINLDVLLHILLSLDDTPGSCIETWKNALLVSRHWYLCLSAVEGSFWRERLYSEFGLRERTALGKYITHKRISEGICDRMLLHTTIPDGEKMVNLETAFCAWPSEPSDAYLIALEASYMFWLDQRDTSRIVVFDLLDVGVQPNPSVLRRKHIIRHPIMHFSPTSDVTLVDSSNVIGLILGNKHGKMVSFDEASRVVVWDAAKARNEGLNAIPQQVMIDAMPLLSSSIFSMNVSEEYIATGGRGGKIAIWNMMGECQWFLDVSSVLNYEQPSPTLSLNLPLTLMNVALHKKNLVVSLEDGGWWCWDLTKVPGFHGNTDVTFDCSAAIVCCGWTRSNSHAKHWWNKKREGIVKNMIEELQLRHGIVFPDRVPPKMPDVKAVVATNYAPMTLCLGPHFLVTNGGCGDQVIIWDLVGNLDNRLKVLARDLCHGVDKTPPSRYPLLIPNAPGRAMANLPTEPCIRGNLKHGFSVYRLPPSGDVEMEKELLYCLLNNVPCCLGDDLPPRPKMKSLAGMQPLCQSEPKCDDCDNRFFIEKKPICLCTCHNRKHEYTEIKFAEMSQSMDCIVAAVRGTSTETLHGRMAKFHPLDLFSEDELREKWASEFNVMPSPPASTRNPRPENAFMVWNFDSQKRIEWDIVALQPEWEEEWDDAFGGQTSPFQVWVGREL
jgi:hypothetical protein